MRKHFQRFLVMGLTMALATLNRLLRSQGHIKGLDQPVVNDTWQKKQTLAGKIQPGR